MTEDEIFHEEISFDKSGCLIVAVRPELKVGEEQLGRMAIYCNKVCVSRKLVGLHAHCQNGYLWFSSAISLWENTAGKKSVELIEIFAVQAIKQLIEEVQTWTPFSDVMVSESISRNHDLSNEDEAAATNQRHLSPAEMLDILRSRPDHPSSPSARIPEPDIEDPFAEIFGQFGHHSSDPHDEDDAGYGTMIDFDDIFSAEDGPLPGFDPLHDASTDTDSENAGVLDEGGLEDGTLTVPEFAEE
jgi:hypothetical protein